MSATAERWWAADPDADWQERAACRGMAPADGAVEAHPFFPVDGRMTDEIHTVCSACPVRQRCSEEGNGRIGIWGGVANDWRGRKTGGSHESELRRRRRHEVHRLVGQGWTRPENIAQAVRVDVRTVHRYRAESCGGDGCWCTERTEASG